MVSWFGSLCVLTGGMLSQVEVPSKLTELQRTKTSYCMAYPSDLHWLGATGSETILHRLILKNSVGWLSFVLKQLPRCGRVPVSGMGLF